MGLGAGSIDTALNNYVALHYSATQMSFLHCFYGVGVSVSPFILSLVLNGENGWRGGYRIAVLIQIIIAVVLFCAIPLWKKAHGKETREEEQGVKELTLKETIRIPGVKVMWCLFINGAVPGIALFLIGLGNGPLFPNFSYLTPENFGEALSPAIMGTQIAVSSVAIMTMPVLCSVLGQFMGMGIFPIYLMAFFVIMVMAMLRAGVVFNKRYQ